MSAPARATRPKRVPWARLSVGDLVRWTSSAPEADPWAAVLGVELRSRGRFPAVVRTPSCTLLCDEARTFVVTRRIAWRSVLDVEVEVFDDGHVRVDGRLHLAADPERVRRVLGYEPGGGEPEPEEIAPVPSPLVVPTDDGHMVVTGLNVGDDRIEAPVPFYPPDEMHDHDLVEGVVVTLDDPFVILQLRDGKEGRLALDLRVAQSTAVRGLLEQAERTLEPPRDVVSVIAADVLAHENLVHARGRPRRLEEVLIWVLGLRHGVDTRMEPALGRGVVRRLRALRQGDGSREK